MKRKNFMTAVFLTASSLWLSAQDISQYPQLFVPDYTQWHVGLSTGVTIQGCESIPVH